MRAQTTLFSCLATFSLSAVSFAQAESGLASYYGYGKAGKGELTCAHRTRPFGSVLRVSYGSRSIQCRVNDRGPFIRGRIIDVSTSAARALGMINAGVVRVRVEVVEPARFVEEARDAVKEARQEEQQEFLAPL